MDARRPRTNLLDVARHAGVSPATVSRVLNHTAPVRASVRARVLNSLTALGYEPPATHTSTALPAGIVALVIADILNPYFSEVVRGVQEEAGGYGWMPLLLETSEDPAHEQQLLRNLLSFPVVGVIVCGSRLSDADLSVARAGQETPFILFNRTLRLPNTYCITIDYQMATYRATRHLLDLNHTRIAYLSGPGASYASLARRKGVERALVEAGLELGAESCPGSFPNVNGGFQAMSALLSAPLAQRATAVIVYNDLMALGALHAIRSAGLRVPEDISVIGFDDIAMAAHSNPPLTTIAQPKYSAGRLAVQLLHRSLEGEPPPEDGYTLLDSPLIVRESTGPLTGSIHTSNNGGSSV